MQSPRRAGFSLIEALVVLAIGGMALAVIFSIGTKAGDTGFALGRRAMSVADADVAIMDIRSLIRSVSLRPQGSINPDLDPPIIGTARRFEADVTTQRATACTPTGWVGRLTLSVEIEEGRQVLRCQAGPRQMTLMVLPAGQDAQLAYSVDRTRWTSDYNSAVQMTTAQFHRRQTLWVRLSAGPRLDVIEAAYSSSPALWLRPNVEF